jgi:hypothetical protein
MKLEDFYFKMPELKTEPIIDDTTLRDGIQMPGLAVGPKEAAKSPRCSAKSAQNVSKCSTTKNPTNKPLSSSTP